MPPKTPATYLTERIGITAVASAIAKMGLIWRETATGDVGIDGQVEFVDEAGQATGRLLGFQVKSGRSYFKYESENAFLFYPEDRHRHYWEQHPLPVILVLHDPESGQSYWADVRQQLRGDTPCKALTVSKRQILQQTTPHALFESIGLDGSAFLEDLSDVVMRMVQRRSGNASFPVSHFDLFAHGLTNIARSLYFGMDVALMIAEANLEAANSEFGVGVGAQEHEFLFEFVKFLIAQNLARVDFADCLLDWTDREMQPHFVAPLTSRGRDLVKLIHAIEAEMVSSSLLPDAGHVHVAQEAIFEMVPYSFSSRLPRIQDFQQVLRGQPQKQQGTSDLPSPDERPVLESQP